MSLRYKAREPFARLRLGFDMQEASSPVDSYQHEYCSVIRNI